MGLTFKMIQVDTVDKSKLCKRKCCKYGMISSIGRKKFMIAVFIQKGVTNDALDEINTINRINDTLALFLPLYLLNATTVSSRNASFKQWKL